MKLFLALTLLVAVANAGNNNFDEDWEHAVLKKWACGKALESCVGSDVFNVFKAKKAAAKAKCAKQEVSPLMKLAMFESPFTTAGALASAGFNKMEDAAMEPTMDAMFKKYIFEKAFKEMMEKDQEESPMKFFRKQFAGRFRRDATEMMAKPDMKSQEMALGEKLNAKILAEGEETALMVSNFTCLAQECGTLDAAGKFAAFADIVKSWDDVPLPEDLKKSFLADAKICYDIASNLPKELLEECPTFGPELKKVQYFKKCLKERKMKTCMWYDVKKSVVKTFGAMDKLEEQTKLKEKDLLPLIGKMMNDDE
jgi:hypothetical protein